MGFGLKQEDQTQGGFLDDVKRLIKKIRFEMFDYGGSADEPSPGLMVYFEDENGNERTQFYSGGDREKVEPKDGGHGLGPKAGSKAKGLNNNTNAAVFINSMYAAGFPQEKVEDDIAVFEGSVVHLNAEAAPKRAGLEQTEGKTITLVTKFYKYPWDKAEKGGKSDAKEAKSSKATEKAESNGDLAQEVSADVMAILNSKDFRKKGIERGDLSSMLFKQYQGRDDIKKRLKVINDDDFVSDDARPWTWEADEERFTL